MSHLQVIDVQGYLLLYGTFSRRQKEKREDMSSVISPDLSALGNQDPTEHVRHHWDGVYSMPGKQKKQQVVHPAVWYWI